jgi:hypothetical protein
LGGGGEPHPPSSGKCEFNSLGEEGGGGKGGSPSTLHTGTNTYKAAAKLKTYRKEYRICTIYNTEYRRVPLFYMALDLMIWMQVISFLGPLEREGPEKKMSLTLLVAISGPKKSQFSGPTPSNGPINGFAHINSIMSRHINYRYINSYN